MKTKRTNLLTFTLALLAGGLLPPFNVNAEPDTVPEPAGIEKAENIDLEEPIEALPPTEESTADTSPKASNAAAEPTPEPEPEPADPYEEGMPIVLLGKEIPPRTATRLAWSAGASLDGISGSTPVLVVNGAKPGPTLCLTAAIHGDELNGIEIVRRLVYDIDPTKLTGTVVGVPIVNIQGFRRNSRYLTDRRDLNRHFPGHPEGSLASRIAWSFFTEIIEHCSVLVDLHTGSFHRTNLPQLRADLMNPAVKDFSENFGSTVVLHSRGAEGTLRYAASMAGVPTVTLEAGEPMRLQDKEVAHGVKAIQTLMNKMGMRKHSRFWGDPEPVFYESTWVRVDTGGILFSDVFLGKRVAEGDVLGTVTDPITNRREEVLSPAKGRVLGMALNQVVLPGFAAYRIGIETPEGEINIPPPRDEDVLDSSKLDRASTVEPTEMDPDLEPETAE